MVYIFDEPTRNITIKTMDVKKTLTLRKINQHAIPKQRKDEKTARD